MLNLRPFLGLALLALALSACDPDASETGALGHLDELATTSDALKVDHVAVLNFQYDWNVVTNNPPIYAGGKLTVNYDPSRLPHCRATYNGMATWSILLNYRTDSDPTIKSVSLRANGNQLATTLDVPETANEIELWFLNNDRGGCSEYDSKNGENYKFAVSMPVVPADLTFSADWAETSSGLKAGGLMRLNYAPRRLPTCRATYAGGRAWNIVASWVFHPGNQTGNVALYDGDYYAGEAAIRTPEVSIPKDATSVELWFSNTDRASCADWDSDYGQNYRFDIARDDAATPSVGWAGDFDFVVFHRDPGEHRGDVDPSYYWKSWEGAATVSYVEVQVWIPGLTDQRYASADAARQAAGRVRAEAVTTAAASGTQALTFERQQGNNFVYAFRFWQLGLSMYNNPPAATGLYNYFVRFSTDDGATWYEAGKTGDRQRRFILAPQQDCNLFPDHAPAECPQSRTVGFAGNLGQRVSHACRYEDGVPNPVTFYKSSAGHDCMTLSAEAWVDGVTEQNADPSAIVAQVVTNLSFQGGGPLAEPVIYPLTFSGRFFNNYRYEWNLSEYIGRADRGDYTWQIRFSADGGRTFTPASEVRQLRIRRDTADVDPETPVEICDDIYTWEGPFAQQSACLGYEVDAQYDATNCEFFVNALGQGSLSHNQTYASWLEAYISVPAQEGDLLNVGMWLSAGDEVRFILAKELEPNYWMTGFTDHANQAPVGVLPVNVRPELVAFFIDVRRPNGQIVRLWQSNGGANFSLADIYAVDGFVQSRGIGSVEYANEETRLFDQKRSCR